MRLAIYFILLSFCFPAEAHDYDVSLSGEFRGSLKIEGRCRDEERLFERLKITAQEVDGIGIPRFLFHKPKDQGFWMIKNRVPYRDYILRLHYRYRSRVRWEKRIPAYHSPEFIEIKLDCEHIEARS